MEPTQQNDIKTLRETLFETIRALKREDKPMDIDRAKAINETSQTIINSVKVEIDFAKVTGLLPESEFIPAIKSKNPVKIPLGTKCVAHEKGGTTRPAPGVTVHKIGT